MCIFFRKWKMHTESKVLMMSNSFDQWPHRLPEVKLQRGRYPLNISHIRTLNLEGLPTYWYAINAEKPIDRYEGSWWDSHWLIMVVWFPVVEIHSIFSIGESSGFRQVVGKAAKVFCTTEDFHNIVGLFSTGFCLVEQMHWIDDFLAPKWNLVWPKLWERGLLDRYERFSLNKACQHDLWL